MHFHARKIQVQKIYSNIKVKLMIFKNSDSMAPFMVYIFSQTAI